MDPRIEEVKKGVKEGKGPYGGRHNAGVALAGHLCSFTKKKYAQNELLDWNRRNSPPLDEAEVKQILESIWSKEQVKRDEAKAALDDPRGTAKERAKRRRSLKPWFPDGEDFGEASVESAETLNRTGRGGVAK